MVHYAQVISYFYCGYVTRLHKHNKAVKIIEELASNHSIRSASAHRLRIFSRVMEGSTKIVLAISAESGPGTTGANPEGVRWA
jgi:hypothetical protein